MKVLRARRSGRDFWGVLGGRPIRTRVTIALVLTTVIPLLILIYVQVAYLPLQPTGQEQYLQLLTLSTALLMLAGAIVVWDLSREADRANMRWRDMSLTDELTGAYNRRYCDLRLPAEIARAERHGHPLCLLLVDVDHFKQINDRHGHAAGDRVLQELCRVVREHSRSDTAVCRYGGDEFAILLPETAADGARVYADRIRDLVGALALPHREPVTLSIGLGAFPDDGRTVEDLLKAADRSLYAAKAAGRDRVGA